MHLRLCSDGFIKLYAKGDIILKKFTKLALTGALALGALAGIGSFDAKPAAAAEKSAPVQAAQNPYDSWGITNTSTVDYYLDAMPSNYKTFLKSSYQSGSWFTILLPWDASHYNGVDQVKIFRVADDGSGDLSRIKTIDPQEVYDGDGWKTVFQTQFNENYPAGKYVAVSYIGGKHLKSDYFTVNK